MFRRAKARSKSNCSMLMAWKRIFSNASRSRGSTTASSFSVATKNVSMAISSARVKISALRIVRLQAAKEPVTRAKIWSRSHDTTVTSEWPCSEKWRPVDHRVQRGVVIGDLVLEEAVHDADVLADQVFRRGLEVTVRKILEVRLDLGGIELAVEIFQQALLRFLPRLGRHGDKLGHAAQRRRSAMVKLPEQEVLPVRVGAARAGALGCPRKVRSMRRSSRSCVWTMRANSDDGLFVVEVLAPRDFGEGEMMVHEEHQRR